MSLYEELAKAYANPSKGYRTLESAVGAIENVDKGIQNAKAREDTERVRQLKQQRLVDALGWGGIEYLTAEQAALHTPALRTMALFERAKRDDTPKQPGSLDALLTQRV